MRVLLSSSEAVFKVQIKMRLSMQACRGPMMAPGRAVLQARGAKPVMVSRSRPGRSTLKVQAIGFDFGEQAQGQAARSFWNQLACRVFVVSRAAHAVLSKWGPSSPGPC